MGLFVGFCLSKRDSRVLPSANGTVRRVLSLVQWDFMSGYAFSQWDYMSGSAFSQWDCWVELEEMGFGVRVT